MYYVWQTFDDITHYVGLARRFGNGLKVFARRSQGWKSNLCFITYNLSENRPVIIILYYATEAAYNHTR